MDFTRQLFAILLCLGTVLAETDFVLRDCSSNKQARLLTIQQAKVQPYPVPIPGRITVDGTLILHRALTGGVKLDLTIKRKALFFWLTLPCMSGVGSCTYQDICDLLASAGGNGTNGCPPQIAAIGIPCTCPIPAGSYTLARSIFAIPEPKGLASGLAEGDYQVTAKFIDKTTGEEIACQHMEVTLVDGSPCTGFLCGIFG